LRTSRKIGKDYVELPGEKKILETKNNLMPIMISLYFYSVWFLILETNDLDLSDFPLIAWSGCMKY